VNAIRLYKPLLDWSVEDVQKLVDEKIDEGQRLEYKRELNLGSRDERLEAAKDASGMANATGGLLIYGIEEEELEDGRRIPVRVRPLENGDAQPRLEDVLASSVSPPLNFAAKTIEADDGYVVVLQIQQRSGPLHMVEGYNQNRYFIRTGLATRPMQAHEVERSFRDLGNAEERLDELLRSLPLVARLVPARSRAADLAASAQRNERVEPMAEPWIAVVIAALDASGPILPMRPASSSDFNVLEAQQLMIGRWDDLAARPAFDIDAHGYHCDTEGSVGRIKHLRLCREGVFEWGTRWMSRGGAHYIPARAMIKPVRDALAYFASVYQDSGYYGRLRVWIRVENADQSEIALQNDMSLRALPLVPTVDALTFVEDSNVERLLDDPMPVVHAAMDRIWQGYGMPACSFFSPAGELLI